MCLLTFPCDLIKLLKFTMKQDEKTQKSQGRRKKVKLFRPRKNKSAEEDAAIQYLQAQYDKVCLFTPDFHID